MKVILSVVVFMLFTWISTSVAELAGLEPHNSFFFCVAGGVLTAMFIYLIYEAKEEKKDRDDKKKYKNDENSTYPFLDDCYLPAVAAAGTDKDSDSFDFDGGFAGAGSSVDFD